MAYDMEGEVCIPSEDFWSFVLKYVPDTGAEYLFGPPRMNNGNVDLVLTFAASTSVHPTEWATPPKAKLEWIKKDNAATVDTATTGENATSGGRE